MISNTLWSQIESLQVEIKKHAGLQVPTVSRFEWSPLKNISALAVAQMIDHTLLKPEATEADLQKVCAEAKENSFKAVCVNSSWIQFVAKNLNGTKTLPICVVGFPNGVCDTDTKVFETQRSIQLGACEIDMVIHRGLLRQKDWAQVLADIKAVKQACGSIPLKVILESHLLELEEKIAATLLIRAAGADFAKTCTGFSGGGATAEDVSLMRAIMGPQGGVKASGGVKTWDDAVKMIQSGANRIGTSSGLSLVSGQNSSGPNSY